MKYKLFKGFTWALICFASTPSFSLSVDDYIKQVKENNRAYRSIEVQRQAATGLGGRSNLLYTPTLTADINHTTNALPSSGTLSYGQNAKLSTASVGLSKDTPFGLSASASYNSLEARLDPKVVAGDKRLNTNYVNLSLSQSLLRNGFGSEIRGKESVLKNTAISQGKRQEFNNKLLMSEAENYYYQLVIARKSLLIEKASLSRAQRLLNWIAGRVQSNLADKADELQARTSLRSRELDVDLAKENLRRASLNFNSLRNFPGDAVDEPLSESIIDTIQHFTIPEKHHLRLDTISAKYALLAKVSENQVGKEALKPDLKIIAKASIFAEQDDQGVITNQAIQTNKSSYYVGLNLTAPIDYSTLAKTWNGYNDEIRATKLRYERQVFEDNNNWNNLLRKFNRERQQLVLYANLVEAELSKLTREKSRQKMGQSTTFNVISFEQEYLQVQLRQLAHTSQLANTYTQLKLYL